jgi:hypothetical protein
MGPTRVVLVPAARWLVLGSCGKHGEASKSWWNFVIFGFGISVAGCFVFVSVIVFWCCFLVDVVWTKIERLMVVVLCVFFIVVWGVWEKIRSWSLALRVIVEFGKVL